MNWNCSKRAQVHEWHETPEASDADMAICFDFFRKTGQRLGVQGKVLDFVGRVGRDAAPHRTLTVLDLNCGRGDLAAAIVDWGRRRKTDIQVLAVDRFGRIIQMARDSHGDRKDIVFDVRDFTDPTFRQAQQFDIVVSAFGLHHLSDSQVVPFFRTVNLLAKSGFIVCDFVRGSRALGMMSFLSQFWSDDIVRHDAPMAVRRSYTLAEIRRGLKEARIENARIESHFGLCLSVSVERRLVLQPKLSPVTGILGT